MREAGENPMSFLASTVALPLYFGNSFDPNHDISYRDPIRFRSIGILGAYKWKKLRY